MAKPRVIVLAGYGLNCEDETAHAFGLAGARAEIVHINDLVDGSKKLKNYQIMAIPGGFSFGDDTGAGLAYANKLKNHLAKQLQDFVAANKLVIGICNGFQILANAGMLPGALTFNSSARYTDRWVDLKIQSDSPWLAGMKTLSVPIAHGEGRYVADTATLHELERTGRVAALYAKGEICKFQELAANPNGSTKNIAAITNHAGRVFGIMPHPERAMFFTQLPHWTLLKERLRRLGKPLPKFAPGLQIFKNAVNYFK